METDLFKGLFSFLKRLLVKKSDLFFQLAAEGGLKGLLAAGKGKGLITGPEEKMIQGILELKNTVVREVMVPRTEMVAIDCEAPVEEAVKLMASHGHSRIPAYRESIDNIVGMVYAKDILRWWGTGQKVKMTQVIRPAYFVPETKNTLELLEEFKRRRSPVAIAVDEYGGTSGLVSIEDLLEEIVGEMRDEYDQPEEQPIKEVGPDIYMVEARAPIEELEEKVGITLPKEDFDTVGGLVFHITGRIPRAGDVVEYGQLRITVEAADERRILRVKVQKLPPEISAGQEEE